MENVVLRKPAWLFPPLVQVPHISPLEVLYCGKWTHFWLSKHCRKKCFLTFLPFSPTMSKWLHSQNLCHLYFCIKTNTLTVSYPYSQITTTNQYYLVVLHLVVTGSQYLIGCLGSEYSENVEREVEVLVSWVLPPWPWVGNWHISNLIDTSQELHTRHWLPAPFFKSPVLFKLV